ncbi:DUF397 domain-containing protein [Actinokineospora guangxiensis]|uniref:DUF397 domain-containing protein n=1 Tax=Actinokineospora guangxiensis TaxID=1490288 RepID=A0ABW0EW48_9PSEU
MQWRRSSKSGSGSNCVEVRQDLSALRDSKSPSASVETSVEAVRALVVWSRRS